MQYWQSALETEGWYPPYRDALKDVDAELANWRPEGVAANTIWETVVHVSYFKERLLRRLQGKPDSPLPGGNDDTFVVVGQQEADWQEAVAKLFDIHRELYQLLKELDESDLDKPMPETAIGAQFFDLIAHDAYHTGQIILIRKLTGSWPERRSFL